MTDHQLNELVARELGWKECQCHSCKLRGKPELYFEDPAGIEAPKLGLPDFCNDMNAAIQLLHTGAGCFRIACGGGCWVANVREFLGSDTENPARAIVKAYLISRGVICE